MIVTDECKGFVVIPIPAIFVVIFVDEAAVVVPRCELVFLGFDTVATYVVDILDSRIVVAFNLAKYIVAVAVLSPVGGIEVHVDVVLLVLPVLQEMVTELVHLTDQL